MCVQLHLHRRRRRCCRHCHRCCSFLHRALSCSLVDALAHSLLLLVFYYYYFCVFAVVFFLTHWRYHLVFLRALSIVVIARKIVASTLFLFLFHVHFYFLEFSQFFTECPRTFLACMYLRLYYWCDKWCCWWCYCCICAMYSSAHQLPSWWMHATIDEHWTKCEYPSFLTTLHTFPSQCLFFFFAASDNFQLE